MINRGTVRIHINKIVKESYGPTEAQISPFSYISSFEQSPLKPASDTPTHTTKARKWKSKTHAPSITPSIPGPNSYSKDSKIKIPSHAKFTKMAMNSKTA